MSTATVEYDGDTFRVDKDFGSFRVLDYGAEPPPERSFKELWAKPIDESISYPFPDKYIHRFQQMDKFSIWPWAVGADGRELALYEGLDIVSESPFSHGCWLFLDYSQPERDNVRRALKELTRGLNEKGHQELQQASKIRQLLRKMFEVLLAYQPAEEMAPLALFIVILKELGHEGLAEDAENYFRDYMAPELEARSEEDALAEFDIELERLGEEVRLQ